MSSSSLVVGEASHLLNVDKAASEVTPLSQIPVQLTTTQKESLTEIKITQLGFSLGKDEILSIMSLVDTSITDTMEYMDAVTGHIQTYLTNRNNLVSKDITHKVNNVR